MSLTPKKQWKRYDPEPKKLEWEDWEISVWIATAFIVVALITQIVINLSERPSGTRQVPRSTPAVRR